MSSKRETIVVEVERRTELGKNANRRLRVRGRVPANIYGLDREPFAVSVDPRLVEEVLHSPTGRNTIFTLSLEGGQQTRSVMLREVQRHPVSERLVHVDLLRFDPTKRIEVKVPVRLVGTPVGVRTEGGLLDFVHREVLVECLPASIPEQFEIDVSELHLNQHVSVRDLRLEEDVRLLDDPETLLAVVSLPRAEAEAPAEAAAAAPAEPQLVGKDTEAESKPKGPEPKPKGPEPKAKGPEK